MKRTIDPSAWPAPVGLPPVRLMPHTPEDALAHLVTHHGWTPRQPDIGMIQAHRYAHGVDGRPDLADQQLDHTHSAPTVRAESKRPLTWIIIAWNVLMAIWMLYALGTSGNQLASCATETYRGACEAGTTIGAGIAIGGILFLTAIVDVILAVIWVVTKKEN